MMLNKITKYIAGVFILAMQSISAQAALASYVNDVIDFEVVYGAGLVSPVHVPAGFQYATADGVGIGNKGFLYSPGPVTSNPNDLHVHTDIPLGGSLLFPNNTTSVVGAHDNSVLTREGGGVFDLYSFDYAGYATGGVIYESSFTATGTYAGGGTITQVFTPDGVLDGQGGSADFQTFFLNPDCIECEDSGWSGLVKFEIALNSSEPLTQGSFAVDNFSVSYSTAPVPEPGTFLLFGLGLLGMMQLMRRRRI